MVHIFESFTSGIYCIQMTICWFLTLLSLFSLCWIFVQRNWKAAESLDFSFNIVKSVALRIGGLSPLATKKAGRWGLGAKLPAGAKPPENGGLGRRPQKLSTFAYVEDHRHCIFYTKVLLAIGIANTLPNRFVFGHEWTNDEKMTDNRHIGNSIIRRMLLMKQHITTSSSTTNTPKYMYNHNDKRILLNVWMNAPYRSVYEMQVSSEKCGNGVISRSLFGMKMKYLMKVS